MESFEMTTMTSRGQIVIPQAVRKSLELSSGAKFAVIGEGDTIILKKIEIPSSHEIRVLLVKSRAAARKSGFKKSQVAKIIKSER